MFLPRIAFVSLLSLAACALNGCSTIYSDTFSNKRNRFVPPPPQKSVLPADMQPAGAPGKAGDANPVGAAGPGAPLGDGGASGGVLPGLPGFGAGAPAASGVPMIPGL